MHLAYTTSTIADNTLKLLIEGVYEQDNGFNAKNAFSQGFAKDGPKISLESVVTARLQITDPSPVFYVYVADAKNHSTIFPANFEPINSMAFAALDVHKKDRTITLGSSDVIHGTKNGVGADKKTNFEADKIGANAYKIYFTSQCSARRIWFLHW